MEWVCAVGLPTESHTLRTELQSVSLRMGRVWLITSCICALPFRAFATFVTYECVDIVGPRSLFFSLSLCLGEMASYACKSWLGSAAREDVFIVSIGANGQAWSRDTEVAHLTINVAVSLTCLFTGCVLAA